MADVTSKLICTIDLSRRPGPFQDRYFCAASRTEQGHCDNRPMTIQCSHCIWVEQELRDNPGCPANQYLTRWCDHPDYKKVK